MIIDRGQLAAALPGYEVKGELGAGAFGLVLAGQHRQLGRGVAIKVLAVNDGMAHARFVAEARLLARMDHRHIVRVHDYVEHGGFCLIIMELLAGGSLTRHLAGIPARKACEVGIAVAEALSYAHAQGVLHRDIKPDNVLFDAAGLLKVTDFGIAKIFEGSRTSASGIAGTPLYMAPEQLSGGQLGPATDIYALGLVLYEMLAGRPAFDPALPLLVRYEQQLATMPPPAAVPPAVAEAVMHALAGDMRERPRSAKDFALELAAAANFGYGPNRISLSPILPGAPRHARVMTAPGVSGEVPGALVTSWSGVDHRPTADQPDMRPVGPGGPASPRSRRRTRWAWVMVAAVVAAVAAILAVRIVPAIASHSGQPGRAGSTVQPGGSGAAIPPSSASASTAVPVTTFGTPTVTQVSGCGGHSYASVSDGAKLVMAGQTYQHGFQIVTDEYCGGAGPVAEDEWAWHIGTIYKTFAAVVGLDSTNSTGVELEFLGSNNKPLEFIADGQSVKSINLVAGAPTDIELSLTSVTNFIAETLLSQSARTGGPEPQATVDFADDEFSTGSGSFPPEPSDISSLEALGAATSYELSGCDGRSYKGTSEGAKLAMAGQTYQHGFQVVTDEYCGGAGPIAQETWAWHIAGLFEELTALVGLDTTNSTAATLEFLGPDNKPLKFTADGASVSVANLVSGAPTKIVLDLKGALNITVETAVTNPGPQSQATIDFANDNLTYSG
jgi:Protein kinase domain